MARSFIGRGWAHQARMRKQARKSKYRSLPQLVRAPVTADDLTADADRRFGMNRIGRLNRK